MLQCLEDADLDQPHLQPQRVPEHFEPREGASCLPVMRAIRSSLGLGGPAVAAVALEIIRLFLNSRRSQYCSCRGS